MRVEYTTSAFEPHHLEDKGLRQCYTPGDALSRGSLHESVNLFTMQWQPRLIVSSINTRPLEFVATAPTSDVEATGGVGSSTLDCRVSADCFGGTTGPSPIPCMHPHLMPNCSNGDKSRDGRSNTNCTRPRLNFCICKYVRYEMVIYIALHIANPIQY